MPLGVSVESVSGFREEIDGCFELFRRLQALMLDSKGSPWGVRWYRVPLTSLARSGGPEEALARIEAGIEAQRDSDEAGSAKAAPPLLLDAQPAGGVPTRREVAALALGLAAGVAVGLAAARKK